MIFDSKAKHIDTSQIVVNQPLLELSAIAFQYKCSHADKGILGRRSANRRPLTHAQFRNMIYYHFTANRLCIDKE